MNGRGTSESRLRTLMRCARSIASGVGNASGPKISFRHSPRKAVGCEPSIPSGKLVMRILLRLERFSRSSVLNFSAAFYFFKKPHVFSSSAKRDCMSVMEVSMSLIVLSWPSIRTLLAEKCANRVEIMCSSDFSSIASMSARVIGGS